MGAFFTPDQGGRGAEVFQASAVCHTLTLHGFFGRRIGTAAGYDCFEALRGMDIVWTPRTESDLIEYGAEACTPGSRMPEQKVPIDSDRAALIEILEAETQ